MSDIKIPEDVFCKLYVHHVLGEHKYDVLLQDFLQDKYSKLMAHKEYTKSLQERRANQ